MNTVAARRPYITHAVELLGILSEVNLAANGIDDVLAGSRAEHTSEEADAIVAELKAAYVEPDPYFWPSMIDLRFTNLSNYSAHAFLDIYIVLVSTMPHVA